MLVKKSLFEISRYGKQMTLENFNHQKQLLKSCAPTNVVGMVSVSTQPVFAMKDTCPLIVLSMKVTYFFKYACLKIMFFFYLLTQPFETK